MPTKLLIETLYEIKFVCVRTNQHALLIACDSLLVLSFFLEITALVYDILRTFLKQVLQYPLRLGKLSMIQELMKPAPVSFNIIGVMHDSFIVF